MMRQTIFDHDNAARSRGDSCRTAQRTGEFAAGSASYRTTPTSEHGGTLTPATRNRPRYTSSVASPTIRPNDPHWNPTRMKPELFHVFGFAVHSYGLMMVIGFFLALQLAQFLARRS